MFADQPLWNNTSHFVKFIQASITQQIILEFWWDFYKTRIVVVTHNIIVSFVLWIENFGSQPLYENNTFLASIFGTKLACWSKVIGKKIAHWNNNYWNDPKELLLALFVGHNPITIDNDFHCLLSQSVRQAGIGLWNPTMAVDRLFVASQEVTEILAEKLVASIFLLQWHWDQVKASRAALQKNRMMEETDFLSELTGRDREMGNRFETVCKLGAWLTALFWWLKGTKICPIEFQDALRNWYDKKPLDLETTCNGCSKTFNVVHAMPCKKGSLVSWLHKAAKQEWITLLQLAYSRSCVSNKPKITYECNITASAGAAAAAALSAPADLPTTGNDAFGDIFVDEFWKPNYTCIFKVCISDVHSKLHRWKKLAALLKSAETLKKKKYLWACQHLSQRTQNTLNEHLLKLQQLFVGESPLVVVPEKHHPMVFHDEKSSALFCLVCGVVEPPQGAANFWNPLQWY